MTKLTHSIKQMPVTVASTIKCSFAHKTFTANNNNNNKKKADFMHRQQKCLEIIAPATRTDMKTKMWSQKSSSYFWALLACSCYTHSQSSYRDCNYSCITHCWCYAKFCHTKSRHSTYTPVHLRDRIAVQAVPAFPLEVRRGKQSCVNLEEGEEEQERSCSIPVKQNFKKALWNQALF